METRDESGSQLLSQVVQGGVFVSALRILVRSLKVVRVIVLARLLSPADFGIGMLAILIVTSLRRLTDPGFHEALIYADEDNIDRYFGTTLAIRGLLGVSLGLLIVVFAPVATAFFEEPHLTVVLQVAVLAMLFRSFRNPGVVYFEKDLNFKRYIMYNGLSQLSSFLFAVGVALAVNNYWALIAGLLALEGTRTILSYVLHPARPQPSLDIDLARELFGYGRWIVTSGILSVAVTKIDDFFVGKVLGTSALAFYQLSFRVSQLPVAEITQTVSTVGFPAISKLSSAEQRSAYHQRMLQVTAAAGLPLSAGLILMARPFVVGVLGKQWLPSVILIQILGIYGAVRSLNGVNSTLANSVGRPDINTKSMSIKLALTVLFLYPFAIWFGTAGVALSTTLPLLLSVPYHIYAIEQEVKFSFTRSTVHALVTPLLGTAFMSAVVLGISSLVPAVYVSPGAAILWLVVGSVVGAGVYVVGTIGFDVILDTGLVSGIRSWAQSLSSN